MSHTENRPIENISLAHAMAEAESPYRELALHARALGLIAVSSEMIQKATAASDEVIDADTMDDMEHSGEMTHERLEALLHASGIVASTWARGSEIPDGFGSSHGNGYKSLHSPGLSADETADLLRIKTPDATMESIQAQHVPEVLTFTHLENSEVYRAVPGHAAAKGPVVVVSYETTVGQGYGKLRYPQGIAQVPGVRTRYHLLMEPHMATELHEAILANPETVHALTDTLMQDIFKITPETWTQLGPQYENWKALNGGTNRIAIRDSMMAPAEQSKIVEF